MRKSLFLIVWTLLLIPAAGMASNGYCKYESVSFYQTAPIDSQAYYFTSKNFPIKSDGKFDVSDVLQQAIDSLKKTKNFGIIFIPEGKYLISKTIFIPTAIRLIGYGKKRPVIKLKNNAAGFDKPVANDKGNAAYMLWFTSGISSKGKVSDAGASTFYSGISNINLEIGDGNENAVALRTHFAQHSFVEHINIQIGSAKAGLFEIGNEMEDVRFYGGDYGIYTTKASPGWPYVMLDTYFEGQRKAAIKSQEAGLSIVRMHVKNVPVVIDIDKGFWEKLYMDNCLFEEVKDAVVKVGMLETPETQINFNNVVCKNAPVLINYKDAFSEPVKSDARLYKVRHFTLGLMMDSLTDQPQQRVRKDIIPVNQLEDVLKSDISPLPSTDQWVNVQSLGIKGDGQTDNTKLLEEAINKYQVLYFPQGRYIISKTLHLKPNSVLIGLHPFATQIDLKDNTPDFGGFGGPVPLIQSARGRKNIISGIGLNAGRKNSRAVCLQWEAGPSSLVNDIKIIGGHGSLRSPVYDDENDVYNRGEEALWDRQYWSLWVTNNGGGVFKNIWSASTYGSSGVYISDTKTRGRIYALSIEHHKRNEIRFNKVENWEIYALQTEEESRESTECQPIIIQNSANLLFANLYMFRVIRVKKPYANAILTMNVNNIDFKNLHNYAQTKYTSSHSLYDLNQNKRVLPWELASLHIGNTSLHKKLPLKQQSSLIPIASGFEMPEGLCADSQGNVYFCESGKRRIYKYAASTKTVSLVGDYPWEPLSLACDLNDQLLVVFKYNPMKGYRINGQEESFPTPEDAHGTSFSGWGNSGFGTLVYSINPDDPDHTIKLLKKTVVSKLSQGIGKALYPAHRWRDFHDYNKIVVNHWDSCWVAPDGKTIIPVIYDLARSTSLATAIPGKIVYVSDEYNERSYKLDVNKEGRLSNLRFFAPKGSFAIVKGKNGNVFIADGEVYKYGKDGELLGQILMPERVTGLSVCGIHKDQLLISTYRRIYLKRL